MQNLTTVLNNSLPLRCKISNYELIIENDYQTFYLASVSLYSFAEKNVIIFQNNYWQWLPRYFLFHFIYHRRMLFLLMHYLL